MSIRSNSSLNYPEFKAFTEKAKNTVLFLPLLSHDMRDEKVANQLK